MLDVTGVAVDVRVRGYGTVWLVISVGFKFSWILCVLLIHEVYHENINPRNCLNSPNDENLDPQKLPIVR